LNLLDGGYIQLDLLEFAIKMSCGFLKHVEAETGVSAQLEAVDDSSSLSWIVSAWPSSKTDVNIHEIRFLEDKHVTP